MILTQMVQSLEKSRNHLDHIQNNASQLLAPTEYEVPIPMPARSRKFSEDSIIPTHRTESIDQEYFYQRKGDGGTVCSNYSNAPDDMSDANPHNDLSVSDLHQRVFQHHTGNGSVTSEQHSVASHLVEEDIDYNEDVYEEDYHNAQNPPTYLSSSKKFVPTVSHADTMHYTEHMQTLGSNRYAGTMTNSKTPSRHSYYGNESIITRLCIAQGQLVKVSCPFYYCIPIHLL